MAGEEAVDETHLVDDEEAEDEADHTGSESHAAIEAREASLGELEGDGYGGGDEHHAGDGAEAENEKIQNCPARDADRGEDKKGYGCGACQTVDDAHGERADDVVETEAAEMAIHPANRSGCLGVPVRFGVVAVGMSVNVVAMAVRV